MALVLSACCCSGAQVGRLESLEQLEEADAASVFGSFGSMTQRHPPEHSYRNQFARRSRYRHKQTLNQQHGRTIHCGRTIHAVATATPQVDMKVVTYSPSHTVVPTYECFNKCSYCNFRKVPSGDQSGWVNLEEVDRQLRHLAEQGIVSEVLVLSGEVHPGRYVSPFKLWIGGCFHSIPNCSN
jgi:2-iminoacetate synthase ThiH